MTSLRIAAALALALGSTVLAGACGGNVDGGTGGSGGAGGSGGQASNFSKCNGPGQCVLDLNTCCGTCASVGIEDFDAVNEAGLDEHHTAVCPVPMPCPKCASIPDPALFAICNDGVCEKLDARAGAVSACTADSDCVLRFGMGCCEPCGGDPTQLIAVSVMGFQSVVGQLGCNDVPCDACIPQYPMDAVPLCNSSGHCEVGFIN